MAPLGLRDLRADWIQQQTYNKYMGAASYLWNQFTSGKAVERAKKMREQEELEEKLRQEDLKKRLTIGPKGFYIASNDKR